jgi:hypothetical protein
MRGTVLVAAAAPETLSVVRLDVGSSCYDIPILCSLAHPNFSQNEPERGPAFRLVEEGGGPIKEIIA